MIRVLIVEHDPSARAAIVEMVASTGGLALVGTATDGQQGVALAERMEPDLVLMDVSMPVVSGLEATRQLVEARPSTRVLVLSADIGRDVVRAAREAGAAGLLRKGCRESEVIHAVRAIIAGRPAWPDQLP